MKISEREQQEFDKVSRLSEKKDGKALGKWLRKFTEKGAFWLRPKKEKYNKKDWL